jgi:2-oxoglutarate dehydrogenase complex dehydrogenase (E1) component-like enzyme
MGFNKGMYSVTGPEVEVVFEHAAGFWSAFYTSSLSNDAKTLKNPAIIEALQLLAKLFKVPMHFSFHDTVNKAIKHKRIKAD